MGMKRFFQRLTLLFVGVISLAASDVFAMSDDVLVIGIRPWDHGLESVHLGKAHFVDFMNSGQKTVGDTTFHHLDLNDKGTHGGGSFSDFAKHNHGKFNTILIDWMTYHHIHREKAWGDFLMLLKPGGKLIVPVAGTETVTDKKTGMKTDRSTSTARSYAVGNILVADHFSSVDAYSYDHLPSDIKALDFLRRPGISDVAKSMDPIILIATK